MGTLEDSFCLKWNDFHTSVTASFADIRNDADLFDVTLICDGKPVMAHKLILSACSAVFKKTLRAARNARDPTIILWDIQLEDMEALLNFMYHGEVNITQEKLNHFLDLAERLQIRGLTSSGEKEKTKQRSSSSNNHHHQQKSPLKNLVPALPTKPIPQEAIMGGNSKVKVKVEDDLSSLPEASFTPPVVAEINSTDSADLDSSHFDSSNFMDDEDNNGEASESEDERGGLPLPPQFALESPAANVQNIGPVVGPDGQKGYPCQHCDKQYLTRSRLKRHVLDVHEKGEYPCPDCSKIFSSIRRLKDHQRSRYCHGQSRPT